MNLLCIFIKAHGLEYFFHVFIAHSMCVCAHIAHAAPFLDNIQYKVFSYFVFLKDKSFKYHEL